MFLITISFFSVMIENSHATGTIYPCSNCYFITSYGKIYPNNPQLVNSVSGTTSSITYDISGVESLQKAYFFNITSYGNGTLTLNFIGTKPTIVIPSNSSNYVNGIETISYSTSFSGTLLVIYGSLNEAKKVLFIDDFLQSPLLDNQWTIDLYQSPNINPGEYTSVGYFILAAKSTSSIETVHVTNSIFDPSQYSSGMIIKRKMTVSSVPFSKKASGSEYIRVGFSQLLTTGSYPGNSPFGTPNVDNGSSCTMSANVGDNIGIEYIFIDDHGTALASNCYDNSGVGAVNAATIETGLDPTLYTVMTIETSGIFCSTCTDNVYSGTSWVYYRLYQEDNNGNVISSTDKNINFTSNVSPYYKKFYTFVSQINTDSASSKGVSAIDLVQVQNYGSPVCLFGCIPPLDLPDNPFSSLWATFVSFCKWIGLGDLGFGAFILFGILESTILGATYFVMNRFEGASTLILVIEFMSISAIFLTSGLMGSVWLFAMLITDALVALLTFRALFFSGSRGGAISE